MIGVIRYIYRLDRIKLPPYEERRIKTLKRQVKSISVLRRQFGPPKFNSDYIYQWAENREWSLWRGEVRLDDHIHTAVGWSFCNKKPPLYWAVDIIDYRGADYAAWGWLEIPDRQDRLFGPEHQFAAQKIRKMLGQNILKEYLD